MSHRGPAALLARRRSWTILVVAAYAVAGTVWAQVEGDAAAVPDPLGTVGETRPFEEVSDACERALRAADAKAFDATAGRELRDEEPGELELWWALVLAPFFSDFDRAAEAMTVAETQDVHGCVGYAFFKSFVSRTGQVKPYAVYVVKEGERIVVADVATNASYEPPEAESTN